MRLLINYPSEQLVSVAGVPLPLVALGYAAIALLTGVVVYTVRVSDRPSATAYGALVATLTVFVATVLATDSTLVQRAGGGEAATLFAALVGLVLPVVWVTYALVYTGRAEWVTSWRLLALATPLLCTTAVFVVSRVTQLPWLESLFSVVVFLSVICEAGLLLFGAYLLGKLARTYDHVSGGQVPTQAACILGPYLVFMLTNLTEGADGPSLLAFDAMYIITVCSAAGITTITWRYPVCTVLPEAQYVARDEVIENLQEGVIVLDRSGCLLDINQTAVSLLDTTPATVLGDPIDTVLDAELPAPGVPTERVSVQTDDGVHQLEIGVSSIGDDGDTSVGRTLVLRDVTERETRKQRLAILNRVLRHNLRNNIDAILAHAEMIEDAPEHTEPIHDLAAELARLSDKARDAQQLLETDRRSFARHDAAELAETAASHARNDYPNSELIVRAPGPTPVSTDDQLLLRILTELLENAAEHSDRETPRIELGVTASTDRVTIVIDDDGPGIPAHEREVLIDGTETPLKHGSGIGLWLVNWGVTYLGGTISFGHNEPRGSKVTISLPAANPE